MRQKQSGVPKFKWLQHCFLCGEDCYIIVDPKHPDRWRDSFECSTSDRGKGNIVFKEVIFRLAPLNLACIILILNGYDYDWVGRIGCGFDDDDDNHNESDCDYDDDNASDDDCDYDDLDHDDDDGTQNS